MGRYCVVSIALLTSVRAPLMAQRALPSAAVQSSLHAEDGRSQPLLHLDYPDSGKSLTRRVVIGALIGTAIGGALRLADASRGTTCAGSACDNGGQRANAVFLAGGALAGATLGLVSALAESPDTHAREARAQALPEPQVASLGRAPSVALH